MNGIDLMVVLALLPALWNGWRQGAVVQLCSLLGVAAGVWLAVVVVARIVRKLGRLAGLGWLDAMLGVVFAVAKYLLVLSLLFRAFDRMNAACGWVDERRLEESAAYVPVMRLSESLPPFAEWAGGCVPPERNGAE